MLLRNLVTSLILYEKVRTTKKRASVVQPILDRLVTVAKKKDAHVAIRQINAVVTDKNASRKLIDVLRQRYATRPSGFSRAKAAGARVGDGAPLVDLTLVDAEIGGGAQEAEVTKKQEKKPAAEAQEKKEATTATEKNDEPKKTKASTKKTTSVAKKTSSSSKK